MQGGGSGNESRTLRKGVSSTDVCLCVEPVKDFPILNKHAFCRMQHTCVAECARDGGYILASCES